MNQETDPDNGRGSLKHTPDCGVFLTWPESGEDAFHPEDLKLAQEWIPSDRVFLRPHFDGTYYHLHYGEQSLRIKPSMWLPIADEGFRIGDRVEVPSQLMKNDPMVATIIEMRFAQSQSVIKYTLLNHEMPTPRTYLAEELTLLSQRHELLHSDPEIRIQPPPVNPNDSGISITDA